MFLENLREPRVFMSLLSIGILFVLSSLGIVEAHDLGMTGMLFAGVGNVDQIKHIDGLVQKMNDVFEGRIKQIDDIRHLS